MINFTPLQDFILVQPDPEPDKFGAIWNPKGFQPQGHQAGDSRKLFTGTVVAVGPGDRHKPFESLKCRACRSLRFLDEESGSYLCECPKGAIPREIAVKWDAGHHKMHVKPGDRVIYPRRPNSPVGTDESTGESCLMIDGEKYLLFHEEQSCLAIIEA